MESTLYITDYGYTIGYEFKAEVLGKGRTYTRWVPRDTPGARKLFLRWLSKKGSPRVPLVTEYKTMYSKVVV